MTETAIRRDAPTYYVATRPNPPLHRSGIVGTAHGDGHGRWDVYDSAGNDWGQDVDEDTALALLRRLPWPKANDRKGEL